MAEAINTATEMNKPKAGSPEMNPSKIVKRRATATILLNLKDFFPGVIVIVKNMFPLRRP